MRKSTLRSMFQVVSTVIALLMLLEAVPASSASYGPTPGATQVQRSLAGAVPVSTDAPAIPSDPSGRDLPTASSTPDAGNLSTPAQIDAAVGAIVDKNMGALLPGKAASILPDGSPFRADFPADSAKEAVAVTVNSFNRLADRPLPDGLQAYYSFNLEGTAIATGETVSGLDKPYKVSVDLASLASNGAKLPKELTVYRWDWATLSWRALPTSVSAGFVSFKTDLLGDFAVGGSWIANASTQAAALAVASSSDRTITAFTDPSPVPYVAGYLGSSPAPSGGHVGAELFAGEWFSANVGKLGGKVIQLIRSSDGTFYALEDNGSVDRSEDAYTWTKVGPTNLIKGQIVQLAASGDALFAAVSTSSVETQYSGVFKSTDRGATWTQVFLPPDGGYGFRWKGASITCSAADPNIIWYVGTRAYVSYGTTRAYVSTDGGASWTSKLEPAWPAVIAEVFPDPVDSNTAYAVLVGGNGIQKITNLGGSWTRVAANGAVSPASPQNLVIDPTNNQNLWFARGTEGIELSTDGAATWTHVAIISTTAYEKVAVLARSSSGDLYAGMNSTTHMSTKNLYKSTDGGVTWQDATGDMGTVGSPFYDGSAMRLLAILADAPPPADGSQFGCTTCAKKIDDPVNTSTGNFWKGEQDLAIPGRGPSLVLERNYNSMASSTGGPFGYGWTFNYAANLSEYTSGMVVATIGDGRQFRFMKKADGSYFTPAGANSTLVKNGDGSYTITLADQSTLDFDSDGKWTSATDRNGNELALSYSGGALSSVTDDSGRSLSFDYTGDHITKVTDPAGRTVTYGYTSGDLTSVTGLDGQTTSFSYSGHLLTTMTDANGNTLTNVYDSSGRVTSQHHNSLPSETFSYDPIKVTTTVTDTLGKKTVYTFDNAYRTIAIKDPAGNTESYAYDGSDGQTTYVDGNGKRTLYSYDGMGNLLGTYSPLGDARGYSYDGENKLLEEAWTLSSPQNMVANSSFEYDNDGDKMPDNWKSKTHSGGPMTPVQDRTNPAYGTASAKLSATTAADADVFSYLIPVSSNTTYTLSYDVKTQDLVTTTATVYGKMFVTEYTSAAKEADDVNTAVVAHRQNVIAQNVSGTNDWARKSGTFTTSATTAYVRVRTSLGNWGKATGTAWYDGVMLEQAGSASTYARSASYGYDTAGNLSSSTDPAGKVTSLTYDGQGEELTVTDPMSRTTSFGYDSYGNRTSVTNDADETSTIDYDLVGRVITTTDPLGHTTSFESDGAGRLLSSTDPLGNTGSFGYDAVGNRTVITDANGLVTRYSYDGKSRLEGVTDAKGGETSYDYDSEDDLTKVTDALGHETTYEYDSLSRLVEVTDPVSGTTRYGYDAVGNRTVITDANGVATRYSYDAVNRLTQVTYPDSSQVSYSYDSEDNRTQMTDPLGTTRYSYNPLGRLTEVTTPDNLSVGYGYNDAGQRTTLTYPGGQEVQYGYDGVGRLSNVTDWASRVVTYTYDMGGRLTGAELPNDTESSYSYDNANRLTNLAHTSVVSGTINSFDYSLDAVGNRTIMTDTEGVTSYTYDDLYRLTSVTYPDSTTTSYSYDSVGNRTVMTDTSGTTSYSYDNADRLQSAGSTSYTWDSNGNLKTKVTPSGTITYTYDYEDRLTQLDMGTDTYGYTYDGDGIRVRKTVNGAATDYTWDRGLSLPSIISDTNSLYLYGLDLIAQQGADLAYYHADGLGSVRNLTNSSGQVIAGYSYDAFGATRSSTGSAANSFKFTGQQLDDEAGLYYLRARYYDPSIGRFTTHDPLSGDLYDPQSLNSYVYAMNLPSMLVDPSGMASVVDPPGHRRPKDKSVEEAITDILNATTPSLWSTGYDDSTATDDLAQLEASSRACGTGQLLPYIGAAEEVYDWVSLLTPRGWLGKAGKVLFAAQKSRQYNEYQKAVIDLAKWAKQRGKPLTKEEYKFLEEWSQKYGVPFRGPEQHPDRNFKDWHVHIGSQDHVIVEGP